VTLKPVPAGRGSVKICSAFAVDQWRKVLLLRLPLLLANCPLLTCPGWPWIANRCFFLTFRRMELQFSILLKSKHQPSDFIR